jgi:hypothetical protein
MGHGNDKWHSDRKIFAVLTSLPNSSAGRHNKLAPAASSSKPWNEIYHIFILQTIPHDEYKHITSNSLVDYCKFMSLTNSFDILPIAMLLDENITSTLLRSLRTLNHYLKHTVKMHTDYCMLRFFLDSNMIRYRKHILIHFLIQLV